MRTPFDSVVELDDLLEETGAYALRYGRPGSTATLAAGRGFGNGSRRVRVSFSYGSPADRPPIPFRAGLAILVSVVVVLLLASSLAPAFQG